MQKAVATTDDIDRHIKLHFALGKGFDDLGEFGSAIRHFEQASLLTEKLCGFKRAAFERRIEGLIERFTPEFLATHAEHGDDSELPIMVVGMPRSGTTLVEQILSSHEEIIGGGEMQFWAGRGPEFDQARDAAAILDFQCRSARDAMAALRAAGPHASRVVDKLPLNFLWCGPIHLTFPRALFIHCRRNPVDTCLSIYSTYFRPRHEWPASREDIAFYYRQYRRLMSHWRAILPASRFVEVDYETLVGDLEAEARRLIAACGLEWRPQCLRPENNRRVVRSASKWQARQAVYRTAVERWRRYGPWIEAFRELAET